MIACRRLHACLLTVCCHSFIAVIAAEQAFQHLTVPFEVTDDVAGLWQHVEGGQQVHLKKQESISALAPGLYKRSGNGTPNRLFIRSEENISGIARSFIGLRTITEEEIPLREQLAEHLIATDHIGMTILIWRLADQRAWPWVHLHQNMTGLPRLVARHNPTRAGYNFNEELGCYVNKEQQAIKIGSDSLQMGDLIASSPPVDDQNSVWGTICMLVEDRGKEGVLDPEDRVVSCQNHEGYLLENIQESALGHALGPKPVHIFQRKMDMAGGDLSSAEFNQPMPAPIDPDNPIWGRTRSQQLMALAGLAIITLVLLRNIRRQRRRNKG